MNLNFKRSNQFDLVDNINGNKNNLNNVNTIGIDNNINLLKLPSNFQNYTQEEIDTYYMNIAIKEAIKGQKENGIPIGSVLTHNNTLIGKGHNRRIQKGSPILHGEMDAINNAGNLKIEVYKNSTLYTTLSPCQMCTGAILLFKIHRVVICDNVSFKTADDGEDLLRKRGIEVVVLNNETCINMMKSFIENNSDIWNDDAGLTCTEESKETNIIKETNTNSIKETKTIQTNIIQAIETTKTINSLDISNLSHLDNMNSKSKTVIKNEKNEDNSIFAFITFYLVIILIIISITILTSKTCKDVQENSNDFYDTTDEKLRWLV